MYLYILLYSFTFCPFVHRAVFMSVYVANNKRGGLHRKKGLYSDRIRGTRDSGIELEYAKLIISLHLLRWDQTSKNLWKNEMYDKWLSLVLTMGGLYFTYIYAYLYFEFPIERVKLKSTNVRYLLVNTPIPGSLFYDHWACSTLQYEYIIRLFLVITLLRFPVPIIPTPTTSSWVPSLTCFLFIPAPVLPVLLLLLLPEVGRGGRNWRPSHTNSCCIKICLAAIWAKCKDSGKDVRLYFKGHIDILLNSSIFCC